MAQKPLILAIETSGRIGSVAMALGERMLAKAAFSAAMRHSAEILPAVCGLLDRFRRKPEGIEHVYISVGPGSFTGLRIAATLAKTMHLANAAKIVAVDTLDVIAANATDYLYTKAGETAIGKIAVILDAKRGQFFIAVYQRSTAVRHPAEKREARATSDKRRATKHRIWEKIFPDSLMSVPQFLDKFAAADQPVWLLGEGLVYYKDKFKTDGIRFLDEDCWSPQAEKVHLLGWEKALAGQFADVLTLQPAYLRRPEAEEKTGRQPHI